MSDYLSETDGIDYVEEMSETSSDVSSDEFNEPPHMLKVYQRLNGHPECEHSGDWGHEIPNFMNIDVLVQHTDGNVVAGIVQTGYVSTSLVSGVEYTLGLPENAG